MFWLTNAQTERSPLYSYTQVNLKWVSLKHYRVRLELDNHHKYLHSFFLLSIRCIPSSITFCTNNSNWSRKFPLDRTKWPILQLRRYWRSWYTFGNVAAPGKLSIPSKTTTICPLNTHPLHLLKMLYRESSTLHNIEVTWFLHGKTGSEHQMRINSILSSMLAPINCLDFMCVYLSTDIFKVQRCTSC